MFGEMEIKMLNDSQILKTANKEEEALEKRRKMRGVGI